jgi:hypothetical protein
MNYEEEIASFIREKFPTEYSAIGGPRLNAIIKAEGMPDIVEQDAGSNFDVLQIIGLVSSIITILYLFKDIFFKFSATDKKTTRDQLLIQIKECSLSKKKKRFLSENIDELVAFYERIS